MIIDKATKNISDYSEQTNMEKNRLKEQYLLYYSELPIQNLAAAKIGLTDDTIINWRKADKQFAKAIRVAKADWALTNVKKVRSREWLLERVMNDHFGNNIDIKSSGEPIPILGGLSNESHLPKK